jgi:hypothetical protein
VRECNTDESDAAGAVQELIRANGACSKENQGEGAEEFGGEFLRVGVHAKASGRKMYAAGYAKDFSVKWVMRLQEAWSMFRDLPAMRVKVR